MADYDLVIRNGTLATASDVFRADLGVVDGRIAAIGARLGSGSREIDAEGRIVTPGGVDSHCHIEQPSSMGVMTADDFFTADGDLRTLPAHWPDIGGLDGFYAARLLRA